MFDLVKFDGGIEKITPEQFKKMRPTLLATGKFLEINGELVNISDIRRIVPKEKDFKKYSNIRNV